MKKPYPEGIQEILKKNKIYAERFNALEHAIQLGSPRFVNVIMLGVLSAHLPFTQDKWFDTFQQVIKPKFLELNKKAFFAGRNISPTRVVE